MALVVCDGPAGTITGRRVGRGAVARGVADGAGLGDAREAHGLLGEADRQLAALLPGDAEGAVAAGAGQQVAEDPRQHVEDRVGDAEVALGAERAVLEALLGRVGAELGAARGSTSPQTSCGTVAEGLVPDVDPADGAEDDAAPPRCGATVYQGPDVAVLAMGPPSEGLEMLDQRALLLRRQVGAVEMPAVAVAAARAGVAGAVHRRRRRPGSRRRRRRW